MAKHKQAFLAASGGTDRDDLVRRLEKHGLDVIGMGVGRPQWTFLDELRQSIESADLIVGLLTGRQSDANVMFELGLAVALRKPTLLVLASPTLTIPLDLLGLHALRASVDEESWSLAINAATRETRPDRPSKPKPSQRALGKKVDPFIRRLEVAKTESDLRNILRDLLAASKVEALVESTAVDRGSDFAVWIDELESLVGNPILIEVKIFRGDTSPREVALQLARYLEYAHARFGLVLTHGASVLELREPALNNAFITQLEFAELLRSLRNQSLPDLIRTVRNRAAHFGSTDG